MKTKNQKGIFKITPGLELNASTAVKAAPQSQKALEKADGAKSVEIDLSETATFDSGTIKLLLALAQDCQNRGWGGRGVPPSREPLKSGPSSALRRAHRRKPV